MKTDINIYIVLMILAIHWIADFVFQTDKQAKGKSKCNRELLSHTLSYSLIWLIVGFISLTVYMCYNIDNLPRYEVIHDKIDSIICFGGITFVIHTIQDYFTSRLNSHLWSNSKVHWFFVSIGFDQLLHFIQLLLTYQILS